MQQEASQRATDGLQPERSDTEEFQAEGRQGGKVPGGREGGTERGGRVALVVCCQRGLLHEKGRARVLKAISLSDGNVNISVRMQTLV